MRLLYSLLNALIELYKLALVAYVVLSWLHVPSNQWTVLLQRLVEPVLKPVRAFLRKYLPSQWQIVDWSVLAVYLLLGVVQTVLRVVFWVWLW